MSGASVRAAHPPLSVALLTHSPSLLPIPPFFFPRPQKTKDDKQREANLQNLRSFLNQMH